jgi:hypothetical protein
MMKRNRPSPGVSRGIVRVAWIALLPLLGILAVTDALAADCDRCARRALVTKMSNPHAPEVDEPDPYDEYEKQKEAWDECMAKELPDPVFEDDDPALEAALEKCAYLEPEIPDRGEDVLFISKGGLQVAIENLYRSDCFHMGADPEYVFEGTFIDGLKGESDDEGKKIRSRLTVDLYYDGLYRERLKTWTVTGGEKTPAHSILWKLTRNRDAPMREDVPIEGLLWDYEKTPSSCEIKPKEDSVKSGHRTELKITNFRDDFDNESKDFNRILVIADNGKIIGGWGIRAHQDLKAIPIGEGEVTLTYEAPERCQGATDTIHVYNACEIRDYSTRPLPTTDPWKKIADHTIDIICPGQAVLFAKQEGSHQFGSRKIYYEMMATVVLNIGKIEGSPFGGSKSAPGRGTVSFLKVDSAYVASFNAHLTRADDEGTKEWSGAAPSFTSPPSSGNPIVLIADRDGEKVQYAVITPVTLEFEWSEPDAPRDNKFHIGPLRGLPGPGPHPMVWAEDQTVRAGGDSRFRGSGMKKKEQSSGSDSYYWRWDIALR